MSAFSSARWGVLDCVNGRFAVVERLPFEIGSADGVDFALTGDVPEKHCALSNVKGHGLCLIRKDPESEMVLNGEPADFVPLQAETDYTLRVGNHFLVVRGSQTLDEWIAAVQPQSWLLFLPGSHTPKGPLPLPELCRCAREFQWDPSSVIVPQGLSMGFFLSDALDVFRDESVPASVSGASNASAALGARETSTIHSEPVVEFSGRGSSELPADSGVFTCPVCWFRFDAGDIMNVAVHDSLRGDPVLGKDAPLRFHATRYNERGQALDAYGAACTELACPHCRRVLPPGFVELTQHILSIVGDQSAGKSYYLSVLVKLLPVTLFRLFGVRFQDADPAGNAMLNEMKQKLFSAHSPEEARLAKTQLEGAMYERLPRQGRIVALPKPFVFLAESTKRPDSRCSVIFYDNAGEHFQPGRDHADSPGAQHIASSSGTLFLFDPFNHPGFRDRIAGHPDPQLEKPLVDQQDIILSEMRVRIARLLNLTPGQKIRRPLAVLVGKCDAWLHLLGGRTFADPLADGVLSLSVVDANSALLRELMLSIAPTIVANAEAVSDDLRYFPVSSFGHSPVRIAAGDFVPDPRQLRPILVEVPVLWILSRVAPDLVPGSL